MKVPLQKQNSEDAEHPRVTSTYVARRLAGEPRQGRPTNVQPQTETHAAQVSITGKAYEPSAPAKPKTHAVDVKHDVIGTVGSTSSEGNPPNIDLNIPSIRTYGDPISTLSSMTCLGFDKQAGIRRLVTSTPPQHLPVSLPYSFR